MKISCEIITDLLPLYHDGVCSGSSKAAIEDHISHCDSCRAELLAMDDELSVDRTERNLNEAEAVKRLSRRWKRGMTNSLLKGVLITALIVLVLYCFIEVKIG